MHKSESLKKNQDFQKVYKNGKSLANKYLVMYVVKNDLEEVKKLINISPQDTAVALNLTVKENLEFIADIYNCDDKEEVKKIVEKFSLDEVLNTKAKTLSGGWQRRVSIAMALITRYCF